MLNISYTPDAYHGIVLLDNACKIMINKQILKDLHKFELAVSESNAASEEDKLFAWDCVEAFSNHLGPVHTKC